MKNQSDDNVLSGQVSLFDIMDIVGNSEGDPSSAELSGAIARIVEEKLKARQQAEKERRQKRQADRERREREEREAKEAHVREVTCMDLPMDWENVFNSDVRTQGVHFESVSDALVRCLTTLGRVDIEYISSITGQDYKSVIAALKGSIYQNPDTWGECFYRGWETSEEYLSGNLIRKRNAAVRANEEYNGFFKDNIKAIDRVLPRTVAADDIYITLGSPWVPTDVIDEFVSYIMNKRYKGTLHDELTGTWEIPNKAQFNHSVRSESTYGTPRMPAVTILEKTLNMKTVAVMDEIGNAINSTGKKRIINKPETVAATEKQEKLIKEFQTWVWAEEKRKERLQKIFEDNYSCVRRRVFDGSFLDFPTMSHKIKLFPYQKNAVARIIFTPNTLLAHDVGAGKTYVMVAAGMELVRMGLSKKNMYVVPNSIVVQWKGIFEDMYPQAKILCVEPRMFTTKNRNAVLERMRDEDFDAIIIAYSCFEHIPLSQEYYLKKLLEQRDEVAKLAGQKNKATSKLEKKKENITKALRDLAETMRTMDMVCFDELGITRLFVDEAHNFKNVPVETKATLTLGIGGAGSKKCQDMMDKVRTVQKQNEGRGVVFATGTPITNSITDAFIMQQYLQSGELAMLELQSFDSWIGMFAERVTEFEIDVDTSSYRLATRFAKFHNLPELKAILSSVADFHQTGLLAGIPETEGYDDALIPKTLEFAAYLEDISRRADDVRHGRISRKDDNMLKITTDGRRAALDFRLVQPYAPFTYRSKAAQCAENVADIYFKTRGNKSTQLIFCDTSTPKAGFNLYDETKRLLIERGIPSLEIAFIHDASSDRQREKLFAKVRNGDIRILIGSTFKLGLGVNVQDRLIALHHLDVPWRPADMTQREGRILRQGNMNTKVKIFRYITEGSFDAYSWQLLETKARFIAGLLSGSLADRSGSDIDDVVLNYAEVKALAIGNPLVKDRVETANELARCMTLQRRFIENRIHLEQSLAELEGKKQNQKSLIERCKADMKYYSDRKTANEGAGDLQKWADEANDRKKLREDLHAAITSNILETSERVLAMYKGFDVVLPANMLSTNYYIWLRREGKYYIELSGKEIADLIRIENFLENFSEYYSNLRSGLTALRKQEADIRAELAKEESYSDRIEACKRKLELIDKKLGAKKKK